MCGGGAKNPYWLRENADATGCEIQLVSEEDAVTLGAALLGAVACGSLPRASRNAAAALVRAGGSVEGTAGAQGFHDAKEAVYLEQ